MKIYLVTAFLLALTTPVDGNKAKQVRGSHPDDCKQVKENFPVCCCGPDKDFYLIVEDGTTKCKSVNYVFCYTGTFDFATAEPCDGIELSDPC